MSLKQSSWHLISSVFKLPTILCADSKYFPDVRPFKVLNICRRPDWILEALLQLRVLGFGLFQNGDFGVSVFPKVEEILIGGAGFDS